MNKATRVAAALSFVVAGCGGGGGATPPAMPPPTFAIEIAVEGLYNQEQVDLSLNGGPVLSISGSTTGTFSNQLQRGASYNITISGSSSTADCTLADSTGTISGNLQVAVTCADHPRSFQQVADVNSVAINNDSNPFEFIAFGNSVAFSALVATDAGRMFVTDGTPPGTVQATPDSLDFQSNLLELNGRILFTVLLPSGAYELWSSDGTQASAERIAAVVAGRITRVDQQAFFFGGEVALSVDVEPWVTDGTTLGTHRLRDIAPDGGSSGNPDDRIYELNGRAVFGAFEGSSFRLWSSDGSDAGTYAISAAFSYLEILGVHNGRLYFLRPEPDDQDSEVWSTDGTIGGEALFIDFYPNGADEVNDFESVGSTLYFSTPSNVFSSAHVWASDGTAANTRSILSDHGCGFTELGGIVYFAGRFGSPNASIWRTDGSAAGTHEVIPDATENLFGFCSLSRVGGHLVFPRTTMSAGTELWRTDGVNLELLADISSGAGSSILALGESLSAVINDHLYFGASDGETGFEPWVTDGSPAGTHQVANIRPERETLDGVFGLLGNTTGGVFFSGCKLQYDCELWITDGTEAGTREVADLQPGEVGSFPSTAIAFDDRLLFTTTLGGLWVSDGSASGTFQISPITPVSLHVNGDHVLIATFDGLWRTDGTSSGTIQLANDPGLVDAGFAAFNGRTYFSGVTLASGKRSLFRTDGTGVGTERVATLDITPFVTQMFATTDNWLVFSASDPVHGRELWRSDGTEAGTQLLLDLNPGTEDGAPGTLATYGDEVFFTGMSDIEYGVWATDGMSVRLLQSLSPYGPLEVLPTADGLYFNGNLELWFSDGTTNGTHELNARPGKTVRDVKLLTETPLGLFFIANDGHLNDRAYIAHEGLLAKISAGVGVNDQHPPLVVSEGPFAGVYTVGRDDVTGDELWVFRP